MSRFIGLPGALTASGMAVPILAVLLNTPYAIIAIFIGTLIGFVSPFNPVRFAGLDFLPGALNLLTVSLLLRGRRVEAALVFSGVLLVFAITPNTTIFVGGNLGSPPFPYFWMHLLAFFIILSPLSQNLGARLGSGNYASVGSALAVAAFAGTMVEHLTGGVLFAIFVGPGARALWPAIYLVYPIERVIMVVGAVLISTPIFSRLSTIRGAYVMEKSHSTLHETGAR